MSKVSESWASLTPAGKVLVVNGFAFNFGFYMLLPYLADHLHHNLSLSGGLIGLVLGLRVFSQQGLFILGGSIGDYWGYRNTILIGCVLRTLGFMLLGIGDGLYALLIGAFLTGFAGALFTPSSQAYLASEYPQQYERNKVFALQNFAGEAGMLLGPLVGLALLSIHFSLVGWSAATLFLLLFCIQWRFLPEESQQPFPTRPVLFKQWKSMLLNKPFMLFAGWATAYQVMFHQLYLAIPTTARVVSDNTQVITWVFVVFSTLGVTLQMPISHLVERYVSPALSMCIGLSLMGAAFLPLIFAAQDTVWIVFMLSATLLSIGSLFVFPLLNAMVPKFSKSHELASYYGLFACLGGLAAFFSNVIIGLMLPRAHSPSSALWVSLFIIGIASGLALYKLMNREFQTHSLACCSKE